MKFEKKMEIIKDIRRSLLKNEGPTHGKLLQKFTKLKKVYGKLPGMQEKLIDDIINYKEHGPSAIRLSIALSA